MKNRKQEDEFAETLLQKAPGLIKTIRGAMGDIERFDVTEPTTSFHKMTKGFEKMVLSEEEGKVIAELLTKMFTAQDASKFLRDQFVGMTKRLKRNVSKDNRYSLLLRLMKEVDAKISYASIIVFLRHTNSVEGIAKHLAPADLLQQVEEKRGESRAAAAQRALVEIFDPLYRPYLITIWQLSYLREGKKPPAQPPATGNLIEVLQDRLKDYPGLIEPDAAWMRNSPAHNPREYLPDEDVLIMWGTKIPRTKVKVEDLVSMIQRMYLISGETIQQVALLYLFRDFLLNSGLLDLILSGLSDLFSGNVEIVESQEQALTAKVTQTFKPVSDFFSANS